MENKVQFSKKDKPLNILLIGNNPIEMSRILEKINQLHGSRVMTQIAFDLKTIFERLLKFKPNFILIDDNIGKLQLAQAVDSLAQSVKTKNIPITVLKNSNYQESYGAGGILDYILKTNLSVESLYSTVRNSLKFKRTQVLLTTIYHHRSGSLKRLVA